MVAVHLYSCAKPYPIPRNITKIFLMPLLLVFYFRTAATVYPLVIAALLFSTLGDILLIPYLRKKPVIFLGGMASFGIAQVLYAIQIRRSFQQYSVPTSRWLLVAFLLLLVCAGVLFYLIYLKKHIPRTMIIPVVAYGALLYVMGYLSIMRVVALPEFSSVVGLLGAGFFLLSDSVLATNIFKENSSQKDFVVMSTYIVAQSLIVSSFTL